MCLDMTRLAALALICGVYWGAHAAEVAKSPIDPAQVATIDIAKHGDKPRRLNNQEIESFVKSWNEANPIGLCKYAVEYSIYLRLKDGRTVEYRASGNTIKSTPTKDYCFTVSETELFSRLWKTSDNRP